MEHDSQTPEELSESGEEGTWTAGQAISFGEGLWLPSPIEDIGVDIFDAAQEETVRGAVVYTGDAVLFGDLDLDGEVSISDWEAFVAGFGQDLSEVSGRDAYFLGDLNGNGVHDGDDFVEFSIAFEEFNGAGSFAALTAIPEPTGIFDDRSWCLSAVDAATTIVLMRQVHAHGLGCNSQRDIPGW